MGPAAEWQAPASVCLSGQLALDSVAVPPVVDGHRPTALTCMCAATACPTITCPTIACPTATCPMATCPTATCPMATCPTTAGPAAPCPAATQVPQQLSSAAVALADGGGRQKQQQQDERPALNSEALPPNIGPAGHLTVPPVHTCTCTHPRACASQAHDCWQSMLEVGPHPPGLHCGYLQPQAPQPLGIGLGCLWQGGCLWARGSCQCGSWHGGRACISAKVQGRVLSVLHECACWHGS
jgi:hypothetical protein